MIVSFFEEYPTKKNLSKLKLIRFPTKLYIAAESLGAFYRIKEKINQKNVKDIIYWPILKKNEGYWMSPFSDSKALKRVMDETKDIALLWDAELPKNPLVLLKNLIFFIPNRKIIRDFITSHSQDVYCAEYFPMEGAFYRLLKFLGVEFDTGKCGDYKVKMLYSSVHDFDSGFIKDRIMLGMKSAGPKFIPAFGILAPGVNENEKLISSETLKRDLDIAKKAGVKEAIVYRLGGLTKKYASSIAQYAK